MDNETHFSKRPFFRNSIAPAMTFRFEGKAVCFTFSTINESVAPSQFAEESSTTPSPLPTRPRRVQPF